MATKNRSKNKELRTRRRAVKTSAVKESQAIAELRQQLDESLQRENATGEVLRAIASSAKDLQPVLDSVAENAARLIGARDAIIHRLDGDVLRDAAHYGLIPRSADAIHTPLTVVLWRVER